MAQILKLRRGDIGLLKDVTARKGELVIATGSIGTMAGPWLFVGESEGLAGAYRPISKIYMGSSVPTITAGSHGTTLDGTPFYDTTSKTLYSLNSATNQNLDITGNLENRTITGITITNLTSSNAVFSSYVSASAINVTGNTEIGGKMIVTGDISGSNLHISSNATIVGDLTLSGSLKIGDHGGDIVIFLGEVSSSIIPNVNNAFDLGTSAKSWKDLYISGSVHANNVTVQTSTIGTSTVTNNLYVSGNTFLGDQLSDGVHVTGSVNISGSSTIIGQTQLSSLNVTDLTDNRIVIVGANGEIEDDANFMFDGSKLQIGAGAIEAATNGNIRTSGSLIVKGDETISGNLNAETDLTVTGTTSLLGDLFVSGNVQFLGSSSYVHISSSVIELDDNIIKLNAYSPFERYAGFEVMDSGSTNMSASLLWDSTNDYWLMMSSSGQSSRVIGTTPNTYGSETVLTVGSFPIITGKENIGDSLLTFSGTTLAFNVNKFTVDSTAGDTMVAGSLTLSSVGGTDSGSKTSAVTFRNSSNIIGYTPTTETIDELDGILGYRHSDGKLIFSTVIDGGEYSVS